MKVYACVSNRRCFGIYLILILLFHLSVKSFGQSTLPPEINKIFFETSKFNEPIWLELPIESSKIQFQNISQTPDIYESGIPSVRAGIGKGVEDCDKYLLSFLVNKNFAAVETKIQTIHNRYGDEAKKYHFIFYEDNFKKNIIISNVKDIYGNIQETPYIKVAHRQVISIDYKNQYEDAPLGMKRTFYSITFTYKLVNDLSGFQNISTTFKGKGKMFLDPDDGNWKMEGPFENLGLTLGDNDFNEYLNPIHNSYKPFDFNIDAALSVNTPPTKIDSEKVNLNSSINSQTSNINLNDSISDIEGNSYKTVRIGSQVWMAENLKTTKYRDGTEIPIFKGKNSAWAVKSPAFCWYNDDIESKNTSGALYNWYVVSSGKLCPIGWHVPTDAEWTTLTNSLSGRIEAWSGPNSKSSLYDIVAAHLGGFRSNTGIFSSRSDVGIWWSSTKNDKNDAWARFLNIDYSFLGRYGKYYLESGFSVRCLKDN